MEILPFFLKQNLFINEIHYLAIHFFLNLFFKWEFLNILDNITSDLGFDFIDVHGVHDLGNDFLGLEVALHSGIFDSSSLAK